MHNTGWICWTFFTMAMPLIIAFAILMNHERHLGLRQSLSETQRIFTSSWWTGDSETLAVRDRARRPQVQQASFDPNAPLEVALASDYENRNRGNDMALRKRWLPASFVRFLWFCTALFIAMLAYVLGEAYAEIYLGTLPHSTLDTLFYVYSWVLTVHSLDGLTGWILGGDDGERVGSYPLGWIFKLYVPFPLSQIRKSNNTQLFQLDLPNLRPSLVRPSPLPRTIRLPTNPLFLLPHHPRPPHHLRSFPLPPNPPRLQRPKPPILPEILLTQYLHPRNFRKRVYARLPRIHPRLALRKQQRCISIFRIRSEPSPSSPFA